MTRFYHTLAHYFIPHQSNNFRAKALHNISIFFYILVLIVFQIGMTTLKNTYPRILGYAKDITVEKILFLVNQERQKANLQPLNLSSKLSTAATSKAEDMFGKNYWAHISPTGVTPWEFIRQVDYDYVYAGENLARDFDTSEEVVEAWMNSPTHRANILKPEYTDIGIAVLNNVLNGAETTLVVQEFGATTKESLAMQPSSTAVPVFSSKQEKEVSTFSAGILLPRSEKSKKALFPFHTLRRTSLIVAQALLILLFIDSIFIWRNNIARVRGNTWAHIVFLASLIGALGATSVGMIL